MGHDGCASIPGAIGGFVARSIIDDDWKTVAGRPGDYLAYRLFFVKRGNYDAYSTSFQRK
jgi:hypothetical protein